MQTIQELNEQFGIAGTARIIPGNGGLAMVWVNGEAEIYLHGAQVTSWRPAGAEEVIFLSEKSRWEDGRAIRGGIPVCYPWFRGKSDDPKAPAHGVVRTKAWRIESLTRDGDKVVVTLATESDELTKKWWPYDFRLVHRITVGEELRLELVTKNTSNQKWTLEEAQHTYYRVGNAERVRVTGLDGVRYLDNMDGNREKMQRGDVVLDGQTDNAYLNTENSLELIDPVLGRRIEITKENSRATVVWNPWKEGAKALADLGDDEWRQMTCVEAANILAYAITLAPGEEHRLVTRVRVADL